MATVSFSLVDRCTNGGHTRFDISFNGGAAKRVAYETDAIRAPLSELTTDEREQLALLVLKVHFSGMSRAQIVSELNSGPVVVTI